MMEQTLLDEVARLKKKGYTDSGQPCVATIRMTYRDNEGVTQHLLEKKKPASFVQDGESCDWQVTLTAPSGSTEIEAMIVLHDALLIGDAERVKNTVTAYHQVQQVLFTPTPTAL